jgi:hypothetical protein
MDAKDEKFEMYMESYRKTLKRQTELESYLQQFYIRIISKNFFSGV